MRGQLLLVVSSSPWNPADIDGVDPLGDLDWPLEGAELQAVVDKLTAAALAHVHERWRWLRSVVLHEVLTPAALTADIPQPNLDHDSGGLLTVSTRLLVAHGVATLPRPVVGCLESPKPSEVASHFGRRWRPRSAGSESSLSS